MTLPQQLTQLVVCQFWFCVLLGTAVGNLGVSNFVSAIYIFKFIMTHSTSEASSKRLAAGLCGIIIGCLGIHKFILGYTTAGLIMLLVSVLGGIVTCGVASAVMGIIGLVEGVIYLTKSDREFYETYMVHKRTWF